ncbi:MAG: alkaline phosphatase family protein [Candidatus Glassbacteria bacterium]
MNAEDPEKSAGLPSLEIIRARLKEMGYLENPLERYLVRGAAGTWTAGLAVTAKFSVLLGIVLAGFTTAGSLVADPGFIGNLQDVLLCFAYLFAAYGLLSFIIFLAPAILWVLRRRRSPVTGIAGTIRTGIITVASSSLLCVYLLGWWHLLVVDSREILPLGLSSLLVLAGIALISLGAGRLLGFAYLLLAGAPEVTARRRRQLARSFTVAVAAVLIVETAWALGVFRRLSADHTLGEALSRYSVRPLPVLLVGLDGCDSETFFRLSQQGSLPNLTRLMENGFTAELDSRKDYLAPQVWNTVATGVRPDVHGVNYFTRPMPLGMSRLPRNFANNRGVDDLLEYVFPFFKLVRPVPLSASSRRSKTLWEIVTLYGRPAGVVNWWATWPASSSAGFTISERTFPKIAYMYRQQPFQPASNSSFFDREVYPPAKFDSLMALRARLDEPFDSLIAGFPQAGRLLSGELPEGDRDLIRSVYLADYFYIETAIELSRRRRVSLLALYLQGVDILSRFEERAEMVDSTSLETAIPEYFHYLDVLVGQLLAAYQPTGLAAVVCDPGKKGRQYGRNGVVIMSGVDVRSGYNPDYRMGLEDVAPTVLYLLGLPVSRDMGGEVVTSAGKEGPGGARPLTYVTSYGPPPIDTDSSLSYRHDREMIQRLRSLGYLK